MNAVFGAHLRDLVKGREIPIVVEQCVTYLETHQKAEGLFRLSGSKVEIEDLKRKFRTPDERVDLQKIKDPHSIAVLLKQFFSQLAEPLFTFDLFELFSDYIQKIGDHKKIQNVPIDELKGNLSRLPAENYRLLRYLIRFLRELSKSVDTTKMASSNLALVFGPNLLRSKETTAESLFGMNSSKLIEVLILHFDSIFS